jgi:hypothetical protein
VFDPQQGQQIFPLTSVSRPVLLPTQPPIHLVPVVLSPGVKRGLAVTLITHPHLVPKSRMGRIYISSPFERAFVACSGTALFFVLYGIMVIDSRYQTLKLSHTNTVISVRFPTFMDSYRDTVVVMCSISCQYVLL